VIDGDTFIVRGVGRVRLIGVDTPETVDPRRPVQYFGKEASDFTHRIAEGEVVRLEFDVDRKDRFGRTLAYVYL
jgi:micrococcal nuclease